MLLCVYGFQTQYSRIIISGLQLGSNFGSHFTASVSKSRTNNFVSSVPLRLPTAHTSLVSDARIRQTTPPLPPLLSDTKLRTNSPAIKQN